MEGFTLIDALVGSALAAIVFVGLFGAFQLGFQVVRQTEHRIVAANIANEEMEKIMGMSYENVGTAGASLPEADGLLEDEQTIVRNNVSYTVETKVKYIVDELDGTSEPEDACPYDYKRVQVKTIWAGLFGGEAVLVTDLAPADLNEECLQKGGIIKVTVLDAFNKPVISPLVEIFNTDTGELDDSAVPDSGQHYFPLSAGSYRVDVSKDGYSSARTYGMDEVAVPEQPHLEVVEGGMSSLTLAIDRLSQLSVDLLTRVQTDEGEQIVPATEVDFSVRGSKLIGWDEEEEPVYKYEAGLNSGSSGTVQLSAMEWDDYIFSVDPATGYSLEETDPSPQPIELAPDTSLAVDLYVAAENSLSVNVEEQGTGSEIFSAEVQLSNGNGYSETQYTDENGNTVFIPLAAGSYNIEVSASGYQPHVGVVQVAGNEQLNISLERVE